VITAPIAPGIVDVHAHWLPPHLFGLPPGAPYGAMHDRGGQLYLGDLPLSIASAAMSDETAILADMSRAGITIRLLSAPPFAFTLEAGEESKSYSDAFNTALSDVVARSNGALLGLGMVTVTDSAYSTHQLQTLAATEGIVGVAVPPLVGDCSLDRGPLRHILCEATRLNLAVLVHPMQLERPEWSRYYLTNLIGNPVETATAVATLLLSGLKDELPELRICFVHGGGCAPGLLGRWTHGWETRADVNSQTQRSPAVGFRELYFDTVTLGSPQLALLGVVAGKDKVICGSDYPFDMAEQNPAKFAVEHRSGSQTLVRAALSFLGACTRDEPRRRLA
jgi:aminocarboxymuconate-semialdehyde decarboxylase